jgi:hypothetical protein
MAESPSGTVCMEIDPNGQQAQFINSVAVPTETSIEIGFGITIGSSLNDWAFQEMQGQRRIFAGNLITLDTRLRPVYCDAWDSAFIQQAEMSAFDASQSGLASFTLNLQARLYARSRFLLQVRARPGGSTRRIQRNRN